VRLTKLSNTYFLLYNAMFLWGVYITSRLRELRSTRHMFSPWLNGMRTKLKQILLAGASALIWTIWLRRNEVIFDKAKKNLLCRYFSR
jgi:hypothetical protein